MFKCNRYSHGTSRENFMMYDQIPNLLIDSQNNHVKLIKKCNTLQEPFSNQLIDAQAYYSILNKYPSNFDSILDIYYVPSVPKESFTIPDKMNKDLIAAFGAATRTDANYVWWISDNLQTNVHDLMYPFSTIKYDFINKKVIYSILFFFDSKHQLQLQTILASDPNYSYNNATQELNYTASDIISPITALVKAVKLYINDTSKTTSDPNQNIQLLRNYRIQYIFLN